MPLILRFAGRSDVGKIRSKNDDSAYAGRYLAVVADGMGGHAGGDVASATTVLDLVHLDRTGFAEPGTVLADEIQAANSLLSELVHTNPRLAGMGTTVTALLLTEDHLEFAHIGDSRAYRFRNGSFEQISIDHTFVQRLVDEGRILASEAETHPHKNVLMRVLGDVDASPELDLQRFDVEAGERWILCSDGLNAVVPDRVVEQVVRSTESIDEIVNVLVDLTLEGGSPDNITVVAVEVAEAGEGELNTASLGVVEHHRGAAAGTGGAAGAPDSTRSSDGGGAVTAVVGPADEQTEVAPEASANPISADAIRRELEGRPHILVGAAALATQTGQLPVIAQRPPERRAAALLTHRAPDPAESEEETETTVRARRPWLVPAFLTLMSLILVVVVVFGYSWSQTQYYVGQFNDRVAIFNGVAQNLGPLKLSHVNRVTDIQLQSLPAYTQNRVRGTLPARDLEHAEQIVADLQSTSRSAACPSAAPTVPADPAAPPTPAPVGASAPADPCGGDQNG
jgi:serine/threonine protein phosphatase PrpC